ncbi:MAG: hypothetical protein GX794_00460, partial [Acholeplasmataceae bacterium]|nr:hypothetical protein [Acholeplasmataceae bacterium]
MSTFILPLQSVPLDNYAPHLINYLPPGATISRLYYDNGVETWTDPISINSPISARESLYANFTVNQKTGEELEPDENGDVDDIIVTYKVVSENKKVVVYYHITVMNSEFNVNFIFDIYYRTIEGGIVVDTPINQSILNDSVIHINLVNFNTDVEVGAVNIPLVKDFLTFTEVIDYNSDVGQLFVAAVAKYISRFSPGLKGFYSMSVSVKNPSLDKSYAYIITFNDQKLNDLEDFNMDGKYFYINGSLR